MNVLGLTRKQRVQAALREAYPEAICSLTDLYARVLANGRNDVAELINHDGWEIERVWTAHDRKGSHKHYRLVTEGRATQRRLIA